MNGVAIGAFEAQLRLMGGNGTNVTGERRLKLREGKVRVVGAGHAECREIHREKVVTAFAQTSNINITRTHEFNIWFRAWYRRVGEGIAIFIL